MLFDLPCLYTDEVSDAGFIRVKQIAVACLAQQCEYCMQSIWSWASCRTTFHSDPCLPTSESQQSYDHSLSNKIAFSGRSHGVQVDAIPLRACYTASCFFLMHSDLRCTLIFLSCAVVCEQDCIKERGSGIQYADNCQR